MLAQEQSVVNKPTHLGILSEVEGTLVLTNKRLIFVTTNEQIEDVGEWVPDREEKQGKMSQVVGAIESDLNELNPMGGVLTFSDVDDLARIPSAPGNTFIQISSIVSIVGHRGIIGEPSLKVKWNDGSSEKSTEFRETLIGNRAKNLNDWAPVILKLKAGTQRITRLPSVPKTDTLEGKIVYILGDMQDKGLYEIEEQTEEQFKLDLDPDRVEAACGNLVSLGLVERVGGSSEDEFYRKRSPLGEDDLSS